LRVGHDISRDLIVLNLFKALGLAILIWIVGFVWGTFVFMTPALKRTPAIPYLSVNPAISFPILLIWIPVAYLCARICLWRSPNPQTEGVKVGIMFAGINFILDSTHAGPAAKSRFWIFCIAYRLAGVLDPINSSVAHGTFVAKDKSILKSAHASGRILASGYWLICLCGALRLCDLA
jgi:hypothetical protein